jgi:hypothetical protein
MIFLAKRAAPTQACLVTRGAFGSAGFFVRGGFGVAASVFRRFGFGAPLAVFLAASAFVPLALRCFLTVVSVLCSDFVVMIVVS